MRKINRLMTNICSNKLTESKDFYTRLFDFNVDYESDWFIHLVSKDKLLELGIIAQTSEIIPEAFKHDPQGFYLTFVVDHVDEVFEIVKSSDFAIVSEPEDTFYGQRRLLLKDPNGALVDISSPIAGFEF